jgi:hypothetical protein
MPLTPAQQPFADALVKAFGDFMTSVGGPAVAPVPAAGVFPAPAPAPGPGVFAAPAVGTVWYKPTDAVAATFAARIGWSLANLLGAAQDNSANPGSGQRGIPDPAIKPFDGTVDDAKLYAAFGFNPVKGTRPVGFPGELRLRGTWAEEREACRTLADLLYGCDTPEEANALVSGSGDPGVEMDLAIFLIFIGMTVPFTGGGNAGAVETSGWHTIADACVGLALIPTAAPSGPNTPGPSGR